MRASFCLIFTLFYLVTFSQEEQKTGKQVNKTGSELYADAPWRMNITDSLGNLSGIPVHVMIHDADVIGNNAELVSISVFIKNASNAVFSAPILFDSYTDSAFSALFITKSPNDPVIGIQAFDASLPVKSSTSTISFTSDTCSWPDNCTYTDITKDKWFFTILIPSDKLIGYDSIIDIKVDFELNWQSDVSSKLRVFRYNENLPKIESWYRGDTHFHTIYTSNNAELGFSLQASKQAAQAVGLDWITTTDHSCDFDNYGISLSDNWQHLGNDVLACNQNDSSFIFIRAIEASVNNSNNDVIHFLAYPNDTLPFSMPYLGDGGGDLSSTSKTIDDILYTLSENGGFAYAAHPFAGGDKLSSLIDGGIWNVSDTGFYANGTPIIGNDVVICNTTTIPSDVYSVNTQQYVFKELIKGGQIWNSTYSMGTTDDYLDPWNVEQNSGTDEFVPYDTTNVQYHMNRFLQNLEVTKFLNKKGLIAKNANHSVGAYRFYMTAGSDAHGSFNYSNTEFVMGLVGDINDNAIGKASTLVYCPKGMGENGKNILEALKCGRIIISDGPIISIGIDTLANNNPQYVCGDEAIFSESGYQNAQLYINLKSSHEFGTVEKVKIIIGTVNGEFPILLLPDSNTYDYQYTFTLDSIENLIQSLDSIDENEYYYIRAELSTNKDYSSQNLLYCKTHDVFRSYTNPIWVKKPATSITSVSEQFPVMDVAIFPNPFTVSSQLVFNLKNESVIKWEIFDIQGKKITDETKTFEVGKNAININLPIRGVYVIRITNGIVSNIIRAIKL